ncbi:MAG: hypothetical protein KAG53_08410, partial [Endozoicomonadaceae bacterium]|nr:hypothetical protein [Endozoicomonadaceae bacterium]
MNNYDITKTTTHSSCLQDEDKGNVNDKQQKKFRQFCVTIQTFFKSMSDKLSDLLYRFIDLFSRNVTTKTPENHTQEESITSFQQTEQTEQT